MRWLLVLVFACHTAAVTPDDKLSQVRALGRPVAYGDVAKVMGAPARDIGSGIHMYEWPLDAQRTLRVGTPDCKRVMYIQLIDAAGTHDLYRE